MERMSPFQPSSSKTQHFPIKIEEIRKDLQKSTWFCERMEKKKNSYIWINRYYTNLSIQCLDVQFHHFSNSKGQMRSDNETKFFTDSKVQWLNLQSYSRQEVLQIYGQTQETWLLSNQMKPFTERSRWKRCLKFQLTSNVWMNFERNLNW